MKLVQTRTYYFGNSQLGTIWEIKNLKIKIHEHSKKEFLIVLYKKRKVLIFLLYFVEKNNLILVKKENCDIRIMTLCKCCSRGSLLTKLKNTIL